MAPRDIVEIAVETGQDHRALRNARDRVEKLAVVGLEPVDPSAITGRRSPALFKCRFAP